MKGRIVVIDWRLKKILRYKDKHYTLYKCTLWGRRTIKTGWPEHWFFFFCTSSSF